MKLFCILAEASEGTVAPHLVVKVVVRAREMHQHGDPSVSL